MAKRVITFPDVANDFSIRNGSVVGFATEGPSLTRQEFKDECDINVLMARYEGHVTGGPGMLSPQNAGMMYADFTQMPTNLLEYMDMMQSAEAAFMSLPANVRREFDNSAVLFVDFASDPENLPQMRDWGLAPPLEVVPDPAAAAARAAPAAAPPKEPPAAAPPPSEPRKG